MEAARGKCLYPRAVQPHRPQHGRHRHRGKKRRGAARPEQKIRERELSKFYLCICLGCPEPPKGRIECFLRKDSKTNTVRVYHHPVPDGRSAVTLYETLETRDRLSLVEVELLTGRTHQIRASFADMGHPLLGDGKYGVGSVNRRYGEAQQALYSYRLRFDFPTDAGILNYLRGREFIADEVPFRRKYFG